MVPRYTYAGGAFILACLGFALYTVARGGGPSEDEVRRRFQQALAGTGSGWSGIGLSVDPEGTVEAKAYIRDGEFRFLFKGVVSVKRNIHVVVEPEQNSGQVVLGHAQSPGFLAVRREASERTMGYLEPKLREFGLSLQTALR